jgi:hypothetical protein
MEELFVKVVIGAYQIGKIYMASIMKELLRFGNGEVDEWNPLQIQSPADRM